MVKSNSLIHNLDELKQKHGNKLDTILVTTAGNLLTWNVIQNFINTIDSDFQKGSLTTLSVLGLLNGNYVLYKSKFTKKLFGFINSNFEKNRFLSWTKTLALGTTIALSSGLLYSQIEKFNSALTLEKKGIEHILKTNEKSFKVSTIKNSKKRPAIYDSLIYSPIIEYDFAGTNLAPKNSKIGRIQRTLRWEPIYQAVENEYGFPKNTLGAVIMEESYGDPVQPNATSDGGLGIAHIQGTTGVELGLKICGKSTKANDKKHGRKIAKLLKKCGYDLQCAQSQDERLHLIKNLDSGARYITYGEKRFGPTKITDLPKGAPRNFPVFGLEYYGPGRPSTNRSWYYMHDVNNWRKVLENKKLLTAAAKDFQKRNGYSFSDYISKWHKMSENWGLSKYKKFMQSK